MTFRVIADATAKREWNEAVDWYEGQKPGLGLRFDNALQIFLQSLARNPGRFPPATRQTRKAKLPPPWPYSVYFAINTDHHEVKILSVWHGSRNPDELRRRLK